MAVALKWACWWALISAASHLSCISSSPLITLMNKAVTAICPRLMSPRVRRYRFVSRAAASSHSSSWRVFRLSSLLFLKTLSACRVGPGGHASDPPITPTWRLLSRWCDGPATVKRTYVSLFLVRHPPFIFSPYILGHGCFYGWIQVKIWHIVKAFGEPKGWK